MDRRDLSPAETALDCLGPSPKHSMSTAARPARSEKLFPAERSALNQALAKALAFRDAEKMPEARQWAAELVRLLRSHDLLT